MKAFPHEIFAMEDGRSITRCRDRQDAEETAQMEANRTGKTIGVSTDEGPSKYFEPIKKPKGRPAAETKTTSAERMKAKRERDEREIVEAHNWHFEKLGMSNAECCRSMANHAEDNDWQAVRHAWLAIGRREGWI